jgi:hypothetical protein
MLRKKSEQKHKRFRSIRISNKICKIAYHNFKNIKLIFYQYYLLMKKLTIVYIIKS